MNVMFLKESLERLNMLRKASLYVADILAERHAEIIVRWIGWQTYWPCQFPVAHVLHGALRRRRRVETHFPFYNPESKPDRDRRGS